MSVLDALYAKIDTYSSQEARKTFLQRFLDSPYAFQLQKPLLLANGNWHQAEHLTDKPQEKLSGIIIENHSEQTTSITFDSTIHQPQNILQAFENFIAISSHSNQLGDFRLHADYYAPILRSSRYVFFHGCGNCVLLGALLHGYIYNALGKAIDLYYSCGSEREFMHVYGRYTQDNQRWYIDADQKIHCLDTQVNQQYSHGLIYQLIGKAGYHIHNSFCNDEQSFFFYPMTNTLLADFSILPAANIYQVNPEKYNYSEVFESARKNEETFSLKAEDYDWKEIYRKKSTNSQINLLAYLQERSHISIPSGATLTFGLDMPKPYHLPKVVDKFSQIFFGRVPMQLCAHITANMQVTFELPEIPWLIAAEDYADTVNINGQQCLFRQDESGQFGLLGMGYLYATLGGIANLRTLTFQAPSELNLRIILPCNALALNEQKFQLDCSHQNNIYYHLRS